MATTPEEEEIIKKRFLTQTTVTRGEPPLKRLAQRYLQFTDAVTQGNPARAAELQEGLCRDLAAIQAAGAKQAALCAANAREQDGYVAKQAALEADIAQAHEVIAKRKDELAAARIQKRHNEEYEVLRKALMRYPKREASVANTAAVEREIEAVQAEAVAATALIDRRRAQIQELLVHLDGVIVGFEAEDGNGGGEADANGSAAPMAVE